MVASMTTATQKMAVEVSASDLPLHCPLPSQSLWNTHPRVFLPVEELGEARCPYCGTLYTLRGGPVKSGH
jgi:uncharacterized Zn-finger protein